MGAASKIGRNDPCRCGSGKKYKKCCMISEQAAKIVRPSSPSTGKQILLEHTKLTVTQSVVCRGRRWRPVPGGIHERPEHETFQDFVLWMMRETLDPKWIAAEEAKPTAERHAIVRWLEHCKNLRESPMRIAKGVYVTSGPMKATLMLAYDLYILKLVDRLPNDLVKRLKNRGEFQGARYEIAVASIFARSDYEVNWLDKDLPDRHCEFTATHKRSGIEIDIEAKSRQRDGVLHRSGVFDEQKRVKGDVRGLYESARGQGSLSKPFIIFIDANRPTDNLPPPEPETLSIPSDSVDWVAEIETMLKEDWGIEGRLPSPDTLVVVTNFCPYFGEPDEVTPEGAFVWVPSPQPKNPLNDSAAIDDLFTGLRYYPWMPNEV